MSLTQTLRSTSAVAVASALALALPITALASSPPSIGQAKAAIRQSWAPMVVTFVGCSRRGAQVRCSATTPVDVCSEGKCSRTSLAIHETVYRTHTKLVVRDEYGTVGIRL